VVEVLQGSRSRPFPYLRAHVCELMKLGFACL
jgi:hypothetical protein